MNVTEQMNELEIDECFTRTKRVPIAQFDAAEAQLFCRGMQSSTIAMAARIDKKKFIVERIDALTNSREHIVYGVAITRIK